MLTGMRGSTVITASDLADDDSGWVVNTDTGESEPFDGPVLANCPDDFQVVLEGMTFEDNSGVDSLPFLPFDDTYEAYQPGVSSVATGGCFLINPDDTPVPATAISKLDLHNQKIVPASTIVFVEPPSIILPLNVYMLFVNATDPAISVVNTVTGNIIGTDIESFESPVHCLYPYTDPGGISNIIGINVNGSSFSGQIDEYGEYVLGLFKGPRELVEGPLIRHRPPMRRFYSPTFCSIVEMESETSVAVPVEGPVEGPQPYTPPFNFFVHLNFFNSDCGFGDGGFDFNFSTDDSGNVIIAQVDAQSALGDYNPETGDVSTSAGGETYDVRITSDGTNGTVSGTNSFTGAGMPKGTCTADVFGTFVP